MSLQWSPADLDRQRRMVGLAVERAQINRARLLTARRRLAERLHAVAVPVAVSAGAVAAAFALGRYMAGAARRTHVPPRTERPRSDPGSTSARIQSWLALAMTLAQFYLRARTLIEPASPRTAPAERVH
jgi:hypothetical protein